MQLKLLLELRNIPSWNAEILLTAKQAGGSLGIRKNGINMVRLNFGLFVSDNAHLQNGPFKKTCRVGGRVLRVVILECHEM